MIGKLPESLEVGGETYKIDSDFRTALLIMQMYNDRALSPLNKQLTMLEILFTYIPEDDSEPITNIPADLEEAMEKAIWFLDLGKINKSNKKEIKTINYEQDEQLLFSSINEAATAYKDVRNEKYMHWWTFCGICQAIDSDSLISNIVGIRTKLAKGIKLEDYEKIFYKENRDLVDLVDSDAEDKYNIMVEELRIEKELLRGKEVK